MTTRAHWLAIAALLAAACAGGGSAGSDDPSTTPTGEDATSADVAPGLAAEVDRAVGDLAGRLDVEAATVTVVSADQVSWGDTSLGCPEPGVRYAQVVTAGIRIVLEHDGRTYAYHGGEDGAPFPCEDPQEPVG